MSATSVGSKHESGDAGVDEQIVTDESAESSDQPAAASRRARAAKVDAVCAAAVELAHAVAVEAAHDAGTVGDHLGVTADAERVVTHWFEARHPGYRGWRWAVTVARASRARRATVDEVVMLPGDEALLSPTWIPYSDRVGGGDLGAGLLMPTPDNDPRLEPGYTAGEYAADTDPAEQSQIRAVVAELGLGRERVMTPYGRGEAAERWLHGDGGPDNDITHQAPASCVSCGYFTRLEGSLGGIFGACANQYSPSDGRIVSVDHGCGGHSDVVASERADDLPLPVWDTVSTDGESLFD